MSGSTRRKHTFDGDDALRELMSSILSGRYREETYLGDVSAVCRSRPESVPRLIALIDRYRRLGRMPAAQHAKVRARIDQVMAVVMPVAKPKARPSVAIPAAAGEVEDDADWVGNIDHLVEEADEPDDNDDLDLSEESLTREIAKQPKSAPALEPLPEAPNPVSAAPADPIRTLDASSKTRVLSWTLESRSAPSVPRLPAEPTRAIPTHARSMETRVLSSASPISAPPALRPDSNAAEAAAVLGASVDAPIGTGTVLHDRYELKQLLGRGGIATVYKAVDRYRVTLGLEDCYVAVKIVQPHPSRPGSVAALGREFHNAQLLSHPNVINVFNIDQVGDASFYTMELLDGERLSHLVKRVGGVLPRRYALTILRDIGAAVAHAHSRGVVHADLKPHNIMVTRSGQVRVLDFGSGLIRAREPWISEISSDEIYRQATPAYASCEQLEGWSADPRDDIYALACLAYLLLTGRHPFDMQPSLEARARKMQPRRPSNLRGESWRALKRGLSWGREQRTMAIEDWLQQLGVSAGAESLPPLSMLQAAKPPNPWLRRAAAAAVIVAGLGLAAFTIEHQDQFDWQPLMRAQGMLNDAWRGLQPAPDASVNMPNATTTTTTSRPASPARHATATAVPLATAAIASATGEARATAAKDAVLAPIASAGATANLPASGAPRLAFSAPNYIVPGTEPAARIVIRRSGSTDGDLNFVWWTEEGSARADVDYASLGRRIERIPSGSDKITVYVPIISTSERHEITQFYVALDEPGSVHSAGPGTRSVVTIDRGS